MQTPRSQDGLALLMLVFLLALVVTFYSLKSMDSTGIQNERNKKTAAALAEAKTALLGSVKGIANVSNPAYLPNPDLKLSSAITEGSQSGSAGEVDISLLGKFPWRSLGIAPLKDGWNECLWYLVSGRFKNSPHTATFNWDTRGQINIVDVNGIPIATNLAALIIAPGALLAGQDRFANNTPQCGGNYDARNYLDSYNAINAIDGEVNYFEGSINNRQSPNADEKVFVLAKNDFYNDQFTFITVDDIFDNLVKRSDFVNELNIQLNNAAEDIFDHNVVADGDKGTENIDCNPEGITLKTDKVFCENWNEMFLLKENSQVNGASCSKVFIFGGAKTGQQIRITPENKADPANYLEEPNLSEFSGVGNFTGVSSFDGNNQSADVLKCLP
jgi:hypothetical protein